jgi:hypothetical protein
VGCAQGSLRSGRRGHAAPSPALLGLLGSPCAQCRVAFEAAEVADREREHAAVLTAAGFKPEAAGRLRTPAEVAAYTASLRSWSAASPPRLASSGRPGRNPPPSPPPPAVGASPGADHAPAPQIPLERQRRRTALAAHPPHDPATPRTTALLESSDADTFFCRHCRRGVRTELPPRDGCASRNARAPSNANPAASTSPAASSAACLPGVVGRRRDGADRVSDDHEHNLARERAERDRAFARPESDTACPHGPRWGDSLHHRSGVPVSGSPSILALSTPVDGRGRSWSGSGGGRD